MYGEKMVFDQVALDAHVGVLIFARSRKHIKKRLVGSIGFLRERGHAPLYVEVGYPTTGFKPLAGLYGWGREKDQVDLLNVCHETLSELGV